MHEIEDVTLFSRPQRSVAGGRQSSLGHTGMTAHTPGLFECHSGYPLACDSPKELSHGVTDMIDGSERCVYRGSGIGQVHTYIYFLRDHIYLRFV
jgi:hypothetical protein